MQKLMLHNRIWTRMIIAAILPTVFAMPAMAKSNMNELELAMRGETKAEADHYTKSFTEGVGLTLAEIPQKNMGYLLPQAQKTADKKIEKLILKEHRDRIPAYSASDIAKMDMTKPSKVTADDIKAANHTYSGLYGLEDAFVKAEEDYGVNCLFLFGIAVTESGGGAAMFKPNNMFGYGQESFKSKAECIDFVAERIAEDYLAEDGRYYNGTTAADVNKIYCTGNTWHGKVETTMLSMYKSIRENNLSQYEEE